MADQSKSMKTCPTCGTRLEADAKRCVVCGRNFHDAEEPKTQQKREREVRTQKMPEITLSLPVAIGLVVLVFLIGAGLFFVFLKEQDVIVEPTITVTPSQTPTITLTPTATLTFTPEPTWTPLPPVDYEVQFGDNCLVIATLFDVSVRSIILENNLNAECTDLNQGQILKIPQPTPTASPEPTSTLSAAEATEAACEKLDYTVVAGDTLSRIADLYDVSMDTIRSYNELTSDTVFEGQRLKIPLCERLPTPGPTPTPTLPPPYYAPALLLPSDGAAFMKMTDTITLQWESVGTLRAGEAYAISVLDVTDEDGIKVTEYVTDTKFIVPEGLRPNDSIPHIFRWWVVPVRQIGTTDDGEPIYDAAGEISDEYVFSWWGIGE
ncbi:MAG: LysM peptidoglycan-binding domain-containing protein [Anaerolineae bacterium]|nr:LysM peptidoglycan-binding domain-containing protein [Anaerolineae bacterium]